MRHAVFFRETESHAWLRRAHGRALRESRHERSGVVRGKSTNHDRGMVGLELGEEGGRVLGVLG